MSVYDYEDEIEEYNENIKKKGLEKHKLTVGTFGTPIGLKYLKSLEDLYVNIPIYTINSTLEEVSYRQAKADLIKSIRKELKNGN